MLIELTIHNLALIDSLTLNLESGFSVMTGESGSGKSITIEALNLLFGERANTQKIRQGATKAEICASFEINQRSDIHSWLDQQDLANEQHCIIRRTLHVDGKSRGYINHMPCPLSQLKQLGSQLMTLISQHQQQKLIQKEAITPLLDTLGGHSDLYQATLDAKRSWQTLETDIEAQQLQQKMAAERFALQQYQLEELRQLPLDQAKQLAERHQILSHADHNREQIDSALQIICERSQQTVQQLSHQALTHLQQVQPCSAAIEDSIGFLQQIHIFIEETQLLLSQERAAIEHNPQALADIDQTLSQLHALAKKHQVAPEALAELADQLTNDINQYQTQQTRLDEHQAQLAKLKQDYIDLAKQLNLARRTTAPKLAKHLSQAVKPLGLAEFRCEFQFKPPTHSDDVIENCELLMATHEKQSCLPLRQIASGGELSRIRLGLSLLNHADQPSRLMIFDEIDSGVSGKIADNIALALQQLAHHHQILCVTHSPQIAARAQQHYQIYKERQPEGMRTRILQLDQTEKAHELARMVGGDATQAQNMAFAEAILEAVENP